MNLGGFLSVFGEICTSSIIKIPGTRGWEGLDELRLNPSKTELLVVDETPWFIDGLSKQFKRRFPSSEETAL